MKYLIMFILLNSYPTFSHAGSKEEMNFFDTKKAILAEIDKRIAADPSNKILIENRKCIEATKDHDGLNECKLKIRPKK
jgi:hypothetical protein